MAEGKRPCIDILVIDVENDPVVMDHGDVRKIDAGKSIVAFGELFFGPGARDDLASENNGHAVRAVMGSETEAVQKVRAGVGDGQIHRFLRPGHDHRPSVILDQVGKGGAEAAYEDVAFSLGGDEVSRVFETSEGYTIIKCTSKFNLEETEARKVKIVDERKREVFGEQYDSFVATLNKQLNEKLWNSIAIESDEGVTTKGLMEVYHKYFPNN